MAKNNTKYVDYLLSEEWGVIKTDMCEIYNSTCQDCLKKVKFPQVHHLTYKNIYHEEPEDLTLLCKKCHNKIHGIKNIKFNKKNFKRLLAENKRLKKLVDDLLKKEGK
jgi:5-methylcytosine-specific restriction endonuclease McrA